MLDEDAKSGHAVDLELCKLYMNAVPVELNDLTSNRLYLGMIASHALNGLSFAHSLPGLSNCSFAFFLFRLRIVVFKALRTNSERVFI